MKTALTTDGLLRHAERLPRNPRVPYMRMALHHPREARCGAQFYGEMAQGTPTTFSTIEFRAEDTYIRGARVTAWYYRDILVKVCV